MRQCFEDSQKAFKAGQKALAKDLSNKGRAHKTEMEKLNKEAAEYIYKRTSILVVSRRVLTAVLLQ